MLLFCSKNSASFACGATSAILPAGEQVFARQIEVLGGGIRHVPGSRTERPQPGGANGQLPGGYGAVGSERCRSEPSWFGPYSEQPAR